MIQFSFHFRNKKNKNKYFIIEILTYAKDIILWADIIIKIRPIGIKEINL